MVSEKSLEQMTEKEAKAWVLFAGSDLVRRAEALNQIFIVYDSSAHNMEEVEEYVSEHKALAPFYAIFKTEYLGKATVSAKKGATPSSAVTKKEVS